jgi:hypothetical protein
LHVLCVEPGSLEKNTHEKILQEANKKLTAAIIEFAQNVSYVSDGRQIYFVKGNAHPAAFLVTGNAQDAEHVRKVIENHGVTLKSHFELIPAIGLVKK